MTDLLQLARADRLRLAGAARPGRARGRPGRHLERARRHRRGPADLTPSRDALIVAAVPGAIEQILDNLLDNAIGVAPAGSTVDVTVIGGTTVHRLVVADHGPGLSDDDKDRATRRFWRGDTSRPGSGLGLAIATSLATASGGVARTRRHCRRWAHRDRDPPRMGPRVRRLVGRTIAITWPSAATLIRTVHGVPSTAQEPP